MNFTETEILEKLDLAYHGMPSDDYPEIDKNDIKYNFFLDLEHGYCEAAGSRIHLYADDDRWAIVFEKCGYKNRGDRAEIELDYVGNCINYHIEKHGETRYISNTNDIILITSDEYERIRNKEGEGLEDFELISRSATDLSIREETIPINQDAEKYLALKIFPRDYDNPQNLISFGGIVRFINDTNPLLVSATETEIKQHIPSDIPKLLMLDNFHVENSYTEQIPPSNQEIYNLIAKILVTKDIGYWQPTLEPNNHWSNWKSGFL